MKDVILKHSLLNAIEHGGKANVQAVLGRVIAEDSSLKSKINEVIEKIKKSVEEVNNLSSDEQKKWSAKFGIQIEKKKVEEYKLPELPNAEIGKTVLRLAPYPSGPLHIGNSRMVILNDEYAKKYNGKLILVFDDTIGSEEKFVVSDAYDLIKNGLDWLGVKYHKILYKSDRNKIFYEYAEELIARGFTYVCLCSAEKLRENRRNGIECGCRNNSVNENLEFWRDMLSGKIKEGEATVRLKTDMSYPNPAFRDRVLLRIVDRAHPRVGKKYRIWPTLEFSWAVDDYLLGITHIIRGKDLVIEDMMEEFIFDKMGWPKPQFIHYGMLNIENLKLSKTEARKSIEKKLYTGWDDPRTWSLQSLRKRGIQPQAIRNFVINMGLSLADVIVPEEILYAENRKLIDSIANRYFAVISPVQILVKGAAKIKEIKSRLHPDFPERGHRKIPVDANKIFVEKDDLKKYKNEEVGLIELFNIKLGKNSQFTTKEVKYETQKIHWVSEPNVKIKIVMPDGSIKEAIAEPSIKKLNKGEIIQLYRMGFCRVDSVGREMVLYFAHK